MCDLCFLPGASSSDPPCPPSPAAAPQEGDAALQVVDVGVAPDGKVETG